MIVFYHDSCLDGTASASAVYKIYSNAEFIPISHSYKKEYIEIVLNKENEKIYILDFSFQKKDFELLLKTNNDFIHIDHHVSILKDIEDFKKFKNYKYIYDDKHASCYLTWNFLHKEVPELIYYIEDRDIWQKKYKESDYICTYLFSKVLNKPDKFLNYLNIPIKELYNEGKKLSEYQANNIQRILEKNNIIWLNTGNILRKKLIPAINSSLYISEIGNEIAKQHGICCVFYISDYKVKMSFRSIEGSKITAREEAEKLGGGGHKHAAAARISLKKFLKLIYY